LITTSQCAEKWQCTRQRVLQLIMSGKIKGARKQGRVWMIPERARMPVKGKPGPKPA
jgi:hypothetical protein